MGRLIDRLRRSLRRDGVVKTAVRVVRWVLRRITAPFRPAPKGDPPPPTLERWLEMYGRLRPDPPVTGGPLFSVVCPVYDTDPKMLSAAVGSVRAQTYPVWELLLVDDGSTRPETLETLAAAAAADRRVRVLRHEENVGIGANTNRGIEAAGGEYVVFLDADDELAPTALEWCATATPRADIVYSDEYKIDARGAPSSPFFKPAWSPRLLLGLNYVNHLTCVRTTLLRDAGGFRPGFDGAQDHDLLLRLSEREPVVAHLPNLLYRWRSWPGSTAGRAGSKVWAEEAGLRALGEAIERRGWDAEAGLGAGAPFNYRVRWRPADPAPGVTVVIPTRDRLDLLREAVYGVLNLTDGADVHLVIVDNGSRLAETAAYLEELAADERVTVIRHDDAFNYSRLVNLGVAAGPGTPYVVLLNNDVVIHHRAWLSQLLGWMTDPRVAAVGTKLLFPDGRIQHAGVIVGLGGVAGHYALGHKEKPVLGNLHDQAREVDCVTAAAMLVRASAWREVGGFNEDLPLDFQDVDFCLRLREHARGIIVYDPTYPLTHDQGASRGNKGASSGYTISRMMFIWNGRLRRDPYYNPHLTQVKHTLELGQIPAAEHHRRARLLPRFVDDRWGADAQSP